MGLLKYLEKINEPFNLLNTLRKENTLNDLEKEYQTELEERAAIIEFDGNIPRLFADKLAKKYVNKIFLKN